MLRYCSIRITRKGRDKRPARTHSFQGKSPVQHQVNTINYYLLLTILSESLYDRSSGLSPVLLPVWRLHFKTRLTDLLDTHHAESHRKFKFLLPIWHRPPRPDTISLQVWWAGYPAADSLHGTPCVSMGASRSPSEVTGVSDYLKTRHDIISGCLIIRRWINFDCEDMCVLGP